MTLKKTPKNMQVQKKSPKGGIISIWKNEFRKHLRKKGVINRVLINTTKAPGGPKTPPQNHTGEI